MEILTLKVSTQLMHATGELQLYSTVSIGWRVARGMDAMDLLCALTVRYDHTHCLWLFFEFTPLLELYSLFCRHYSIVSLEVSSIRSMQKDQPGLLVEQLLLPC